MNNKIKVYIKVDNNGNIIDINSDIFIKDLNGWILVDEGCGDKYAHAQNNYLQEPLMKEDGTYRYNYKK